MKLVPSLFATSALVLALSAGASLNVLSTPVLAAKTGKVAKNANKEAKKDERVLASLTPEMLEKVLGKPLTAEQTTSVTDAQKAFLASVAKGVGLTSDDLVAKIKEYRAAHRGKGKNVAAAPTAAVAPAAN